MWEFIELFVMICDRENLYRLAVVENEECPIGTINSKTPNTHRFWFEEFGVEAWMKRVRFEKHCLFEELFLKAVLLEIGEKSGV